MFVYCVVVAPFCLVCFVVLFVVLVFVFKLGASLLAAPWCFVLLAVCVLCLVVGCSRFCFVVRAWCAWCCVDGVVLLVLFGLVVFALFVAVV